MGTIFLIYIVAQLMTKAFGLAVIDKVQTTINARLHDKGYVLKNKNSLYNFNDGLIAFAKGFIPFYYLKKALDLTSGENAIEKEVERVISSGKYMNINQEEEKVEEYIPQVTLQEDIQFEKPERYQARRNDLTLYDTYVTPIEYVTKEEKDQTKLSLTPFTGDNKVVEQVMVTSPVSKNDIARAIGELSVEELEALSNTITTLTQIKRKNRQLSLKDVA